MTPTARHILAGAIVMLLSHPGLGFAEPDLRLVDAVKSQHHGAVQTLLQDGVDVSAAQPDGTTALHWAVYWNAHETVDLLIDAGAGINAVNDFGATPLWTACTEGRADMIGRLLEAGADPNVALRLGETPLMTAVRTGNVDAVELLLTGGADPNAREQSRGQTALMWAVSQGHHGVARLLLARGADVSARSSVRPMLVNAGEDGLTRRFDDFTDLIREAQGGFTPLLFAVRRDDVTSAEMLLEAGAHVDEVTPMGATALVLATHSGHWETASFLLDHGADPNADGGGYTALHTAILRNNPDFVDRLLDSGADPDIRITQATPWRRFSHDVAIDPSWAGGTSYWLAAKLGNVNFMRTLMAAGSDPHALSSDGSTALIAAAAGARRVRQRPQAAERQALEAVTLALEFGVEININAVDDMGETAVHIAAARRLNEVVEFLASHDAHLDLQSHEGQTPLALASQDFSGLTVVQLSYQRHRPTRQDESTADLLRSLGAAN
jgi:ankyrin repeat protein